MDVNMLTAVPDDGAISVRLLGSPIARPVFTFPGGLMFMQFIKRDDFRAHPIWFGPGAAPDAERTVDKGLPFFNHIGDADTCGVGLTQADEYLESIDDAVVFNHPAAVRGTRRDIVLRRIEDIPGVDAPKAVRFVPKRREHVLEAIAAHDLAWPVIVRTAGEHGGRNMVKLEGPDRVADLDVLPIDGRALQVIEFRDFRDPDGVFRKWRLVFVDGEVFLRHVMMHEQSWNLHSNQRSTSDELIAEEVRLLAGFEAETLPKIESALQEIDRRVGLDFFGIDCHIDADGRITVFEANPCMKAFHSNHPEFAIWDDVIGRSWAAMVKLLRDPSRWRGAPKHDAN